jgi:hypothetical protein
MIAIIICFISLFLIQVWFCPCAWLKQAKLPIVCCMLSRNMSQICHSHCIKALVFWWSFSAATAFLQSLFMAATISRNVSPHPARFRRAELYVGLSGTDWLARLT